MIAKQLFTALNVLHINDFIHRDIKMENLLIREGAADGSVLEVKLTDFGLSTKVRVGESATDFVGSKFYLSPEIYQNLPYSQKTDIWSAMITLYILFVGDMPFYSDDIDDIKDRVIHHDFAAEFTEANPQWEHLGAEARDFMQLGFAKDTDERPTSAELLEHPWLRDVELPLQKPYATKTDT